MEDWEWLSPLLLRWPIRYLPRVIGKLASIRHYIRGPTILEVCQADLARCQSELDAANERHRTEVDNIKKAISAVVAGQYIFIHNRVTNSQLTAECRDNELANRLLEEELAKWRIMLMGVSFISSAPLLKETLGSHFNLVYQPRILVYTLRTDIESVDEIVNPEQIIVELDELKRIPEVKGNQDLLRTIRETIALYQQELSN